MKKKILIGILVLLILACIGGYLFRESLLEEAGRFMAPQSESYADAAILEGSDYISVGFIEKGKDLLSSGRAKKIFIVIHRIAPAHRPFGIDGDYPNVVREKLIHAGLKEELFKIIVTPIRNPVTLKEAQFAMKEIAAHKIGSAILVSPSFHTRRSYLAYQLAANSLNIKIYPLASFTDFNQERWWVDETGWRDFAAESAKLFYYLLGGHLPLKFSY